MAKVFIQESTLTSIGDAIRGKTGKTELIDPANMSTEIANIPAGGGGNEPTAEELTITGDCVGMFRNNKWNWFIERYGNRITTTNISNAGTMFDSSGTLKAIPFTINLGHTGTAPIAMNNMFNYCGQLEAAPKIVLTKPRSSMQSMFSNCGRIRTIPDDYFADWDFTQATTTAHGNSNSSGIFASCYSLRKIPTSLFDKLPDWITTSTSNMLYSNMCNYCSSMDEVVDIPVCSVAITSNVFGSTFANAARLKRITFKTNEDGSAKTANWKGQLINFYSQAGYSAYGPTSSNCYIVTKNSGITADKYVSDDASYQALKNDPDWFTSLEAYSRYNHDSAVETLNTLPDTSAYLAANGGSNTIKFRGGAGSKTDGGAINTLTEEEIAVATAKGWTVTFA